MKSFLRCLMMAVLMTPLLWMPATAEEAATTEVAVADLQWRTSELLPVPVGYEGRDDALIRSLS